MEKKLNVKHIFNYLVRKCNNKTIGDLERLTKFMNKKSEAGYIGIVKFDHEEHNYCGIYTAGVNKNSLGALFIIEDDNITLVEQGELYNGIVPALTSEVVKRFKTVFLHVEPETTPVEEPVKEPELPEIHTQDGIEYIIVSQSSRGRHNSIYGSDNMIIEVQNDVPAANVKEVFGGPLTEVNNLRN